MRAALYLRVSTFEQMEGYSIPAQRDRLTSYAHSQDWDVVGVYVEEGRSAKDMDRPELKRMLMDIEKGKIDIVLVYKLDRLTRSVLDLHKLLESFEKHNCKFKSATELYDTSTPIGRMFITLVGALAQFEREQLAERVRFGMTQKVRGGEWHGGPLPYGYDYNGELTINQEEATIVWKIFELYLSGMGDEKISFWLNERGIRTKSGGEWYSTTVRYLLMNPIYTGSLRWQIDGEYVPIENSVPAVLSIETFEQAQRIRQIRFSTHPRAIASTYVFTGSLRCGRCGGTVKGLKQRNRNKPTFHYICANRRTKKCDLPTIDDYLMEETFLKKIKEVMEQLKTESIAEEVAATSEQEKDDTTDLHVELKKLRNKRKRMQEGFISGLIEADELQEFLRENRQREEEILSLLQESNQRPQQLSQDELVKELQEFESNWTLLTPEEKKATLSLFVRQITVDMPYKENPRDKSQRRLDMQIEFS